MSKHYRKFFKTAGTLLLLLGAVASAGLPGTAAQETEALTEAFAKAEEAGLTATADAFATDLLAGEYEKLKTGYRYDQTMQAFMESGQMEPSFAPALAAAGALMEQKPAFPSGTQGSYRNVDVPLLCQLQPWNLTITFTSGGEIAGLHISSYAEGTPALPDGITETELELAAAGGRTLPGTFTAPADAEAYDAVIFVHGSGASDRNETVGNIRPFQDLAWGLAQNGIASYRYDKVSSVYGAELAADPDFTVYDETVNDAVAAIRMLRSQPNIRSVYVAGHSQGGMMMGAIAKDGQPDGCIMMAAPAESYADTIERQIAFLKSLNPDPSAAEEDSYEALEALADALRDPDALSDDTVLAGGMHRAYVKSLADYDAVAAAGEITVPVLLLQGEEDYQITMEDFRIWKDAFSGRESWTFRSFPGLTHLFTEGRYENGPADYAKDAHIPQDVIDCISDFVNTTAKAY